VGKERDASTGGEEDEGMIKSETKIMREIMLELTKVGSRIFRSNTGNGYMGKFVTILPNGDVVLRNWRRVQFGLCVGGSDLIGWTPVTITKDMVGKICCVFTAIEVKRPRKKPTQAQTDFIEAVKKAGGIAMVACSVEEVLREIT